MPILRRAQCDVCGKAEWEAKQNAGWPNWMIIQGVILNGVDAPWVCPECREPIMNFIDDLVDKRIKT